MITIQHVLRCVAASLVLGHVAAQYPEFPRSIHIAGEFGGRRGVATVRDQQLNWRSGSAVDWSVTLPFDAVTGGAIVAGDLVVCGTTPTEGVLVRVVAREGLLVAESLRMGTRRIGAIAYDAKDDQVFLADFRTGEVFRHARRAPMPPDHEWELVTTIPGAHRRMWADTERGGLVVGNKWIHREPGGWVTEVLPEPPDLVPKLRSPRPSTGPLTISTSATGNVVLEEEGGPLRLLGAASVGTRAFALPTGAQMDLGKRYRVVFEGQGEVHHGAWFSPEWRQGRVARAGTVSSVEPCGIDLQRAFVGSNLMSLTGAAELAAPHTAMEWVAWYRVADRAEPPPVDVVDGVTWLRPAAGLVLMQDGGEGKGVRGAMPVPLPSDAGLSGKIVYMQYVVLVRSAVLAQGSVPADQGVGVSDVVGGVVSGAGSRRDLESSKFLAGPTKKFWQNHGVDADAIRARIARARALLRP